MLAGLAVVAAIGLTVAGWYVFVRPDDTDALGKKPVLRQLPDEGPQPVATPGTADPDLLLPDLQALPPEELAVETDARDGTRKIRFSTTTINRGEGPLDMRGAFNPATGRTRATQRIVSRVADGVVERVAGEFVFHPGHDHWHFESFTEFELWTYRPGGELERQLATTGKMTFCVMDTSRIASPPPGAPTRGAYGGCGRDTQGISAGWGDTYRASTPGQELDIRGVPDGRYAIRSTADPENRLLETDDTNNSSIVYIQLTGNRIERLPGP